MQRHLALFTHEERLGVVLAVQEAKLAVSPLRLAGGILLGANDPVLKAVKPSIQRGTNARSFPIITRLSGKLSEYILVRYLDYKLYFLH